MSEVRRETEEMMREMAQARRIWWALIPAVLAVIFAMVGFFISWGFTEGTDSQVTELSELRSVIEETQQRLEALEQGKAAEAIGEEVLNDLSNRLTTIEETLKPLREGTEFTSAEFSVLLYEIERTRQDLDTQQAAFEGISSNNFSSLKFMITMWMVVVSILFSIAIALLVYFLQRRPAGTATRRKE